MKVNIREVIAGQKNKINIEAKEEIKDIGYFGDDVAFITPVTLKAEILKVDNEIFISGTVEGIVEFHCARCLKRFQREIKERVYAQFGTGRMDDEEMEDSYPVVDEMIDISEIIRNTLIASLPMKVVCDENCKGLCSVCGRDLNVEMCNCKIEEIDPRLAKLKDLLQQG
ncbi:YceD family protein [Thermotalea metallivorans]|uniref:Large ribosomal RNA subunit accumulation protein YceD n=1 Tax=Thermotalea metallivorans TaxID=520762 RepID=A0A140L631_9FIRM|nr:DUF177 domain-containing protein [Thermotalea metallivorans]KXG76006.1 hypothetical protein AN619_14700 [Thermotalea metallivorans]